MKRVQMTAMTRSDDMLTYLFGCGINICSCSGTLKEADKTKKQDWHHEKLLVSALLSHGSNKNFFSYIIFPSFLVHKAFSVTLFMES